MDQLPNQAVGKVVLWWRLASRPRRAGHAFLAGSPSNASDLGRTLALAIELGALETSCELFDRLLRMADSRLSLDSLVPLLEAALLLGRGEVGAELAARRRDELRRSARGATLLTLLGLGGPTWLPNGRPNLLGWSRRVESGELSANDLAVLASRRARAWLSPELQLPFFSALWRQDPPRALTFLNRYFALFGMSEPLRLSESQSSDPLSCLRSVASGKSDGPLVSVLVAAYNAATTVTYAIDSLLAQSHRNLEVLIGDDASTDDTWAILARYAGDPRVRTFHSNRNQGAYNLRNALVPHARGELITFHDADDFALSQRIERQVTRLSRFGEHANTSNLLRIKTDGSVVFFKDQKATRLSRVSLLVRRYAFEAVGGFRGARVGADEELQARLRERFGPKAIGRIKLPLSLCLWSPLSATRVAGSESLDDGYRSPSRRAYSELIYRRFVARESVSDEELDQRLRETGNFVSPSSIVEAPAVTR